jgi:hypothetical protein
LFEFFITDVTYIVVEVAPDVGLFFDSLFDDARIPVALFGDDEFGDVGFFALGVVAVVAVDDDIGG